ncbi:MAG TPA: hypothetical protein VFQ91_27155 [Bryobacteraceae bacterium]|nr:hypothetical protein [Bryobacteraceae bacterium]
MRQRFFPRRVCVGTVSFRVSSGGSACRGFPLKNDIATLNQSFFRFFEADLPAFVPNHDLFEAHLEALDDRPDCLDLSPD